MVKGFILGAVVGGNRDVVVARFAPRICRAQLSSPSGARAGDVLWTVQQKSEGLLDKREGAASLRG